MGNKEACCRKEDCFKDSQESLESIRKPILQQRADSNVSDSDDEYVDDNDTSKFKNIDKTHIPFVNDFSESLGSKSDKERVDKSEIFFANDRIREIPLLYRNILSSYREKYPNSIDGLKQNLHIATMRKHVLEDSSLFLGDLNQGLRDGFGISIWPLKCIYEGGWKSDLFEGQGRYIDDSGNVYEGEWRKGKLNGEGSFHSPGGNSYVGQWINDSPHGRGIEQWKNGDHYQGSFRNGLKEGIGRLILPSGTNYIGSFMSNVYNGPGKLTYIDGRIYKGSFKGGKMHGFGIFSWPDGRLYIGNYAWNKKNGLGILMVQNREDIEGEWRNGEFVQHVCWVDDGLIKKCKEEIEEDEWDSFSG